MSTDYAGGPPIGRNTHPIQGSPFPARAFARYVSENATVSSVLTLTDDTTAVEVATGGTLAVMRWVTTGDTQASIVAVAGSTSNFDHAIPANTVRRFVVPIELSTRQASTVGWNVQNGLFKRIAVKTQGIASVLVSEH